MTDSQSIIEIIVKLWNIFSENLSNVYSTLTTPIISLIYIDDPVIALVFRWIADQAGLGEYTLITFMFGLGLPIFIGLTVVKWFFDLAS